MSDNAIANLVRSLRDWRGDPDEVMQEAADELDRLTRELEEARKDQARYLVLRDDPATAQDVVLAVCGDTDDDTDNWGNALDGWCDAAIRSLPEEP